MEQLSAFREIFPGHDGMMRVSTRTQLSFEARFSFSFCSSISLLCFEQAFPRRLRSIKYARLIAPVPVQNGVPISRRPLRRRPEPTCHSVPLRSPPLTCRKGRNENLSSTRGRRCSSGESFPFLIRVLVVYPNVRISADEFPLFFLHIQRGAHFFRNVFGIKIVDHELKRA